MRTLSPSLAFCLIVLGVPASVAAQSAQPADQAGSSADDDGFNVGIPTRARFEWWKGLVAMPVPEESYDFWNLRVRPYLHYSGTHIGFVFQVQYAGGFDLPDEAAGGPGAIYYAVNRERNPQDVDVLELYGEVKDYPVDGLGARIGRQGMKGGEEVLYKDQHVFNWIKKKRLSERLIGNWDWTNVGRRYDAVTLYYEIGKVFLDGFAARVLAGGFEYRDAMERLQGLNIYGISVTLERGMVLPATELRFFDFYYYDDRRVARQVTGGTMNINTTGASWVGVYELGPGLVDTMLWGAFQLGKWGDFNQVAFAGIAEAGYQLPDLVLRPWLRAGFAYGSGDESPAHGTHETFFDMTPTNHKYYGYMDTTALANLYNLYVQLLIKPTDSLLFHIEPLLFWVADTHDSWYAGSGPSNEHTFGYAGGYDVATRTITRLTNGRRFIGTELDVVVSYQLADYLDLLAGYSHFFGAGGAGQVFPAASNGDWVFVQLLFHP